MWPTYVFVAIDHFSRKVVAIVPLEGPNSGWTCDALEAAFRAFGSPRHLISDHQGVFVGSAFNELLTQWQVKHRLGAVGKHGSIAVTERVIRTLKYEWLFCVPLIKGFGPLTALCEQFCAEFDQNCFDPDFPIHDLSSFDDAVHEVFGRVAWSPDVVAIGSERIVP